MARREAGVPGSGDRGEREREPRAAHEREAAVAGREQRQRDEQRRPGADVVDHAPGERAADDADPQQNRDHRARGLDPHPPHFVQIDHEERDHDPVAERVCDAAGLQQPDRSRKLRLQAFKIGGDGFQRGKRVLPNRETCPEGSSRSPAPALAAALLLVCNRRFVRLA